MASRYITLILPLWLGIYLVCTTRRERWLAIGCALLFWIAGLWSFRDTFSRPVRDWLGTMGATKDQCALFQSFTTRKAGWVDTFLKSGSWQAAQAAYGPCIYPVPEASNLPGKLSYLRSHRLSFYSANEPSLGFLPWAIGVRAVWDNEFPFSSSPRRLFDTVRAQVISDKAGVAELHITPGPVPAGDHSIDIMLNGTTTTLEFAGSPAVFPLPLMIGFNQLVVTRHPQPSEDLDNALFVEVVRARR
jgi:hypothetical protein